MMVVAAGMALIIISGKLDISVGSIAYVASAIFALLMRHTAFPQRSDEGWRLSPASFSARSIPRSWCF